MKSGWKVGPASEPSISSDGRFVAFATRAQFVKADTNLISDVYVRDRETGAVRRVSDHRGGDQPVIDAIGRFVAYRSLEQFPKIRFADLDSRQVPRTVSYPFGGGRSFRFADSAIISADGRFVAFSFRPTPGFTSSSDPQLCVNDTREEQRVDSGSFSITGDFSLSTLGRSAMSRDGNTFFLETDDSLVAADTNGTTDIYMATRGSTFVVRLSATGGGLPEEGAARDPVLSADGSTVFFISERQLRSEDDDGRATIYRSTSADNFQTPIPILTNVRPLALSTQAASTGEYLVFLGKSDAGVTRPYLVRVSTGQVTALAPSAISTGAPVISADNRFIAFATLAALDGRDTNPGADIYLVPNPDAATVIPAPVVDLNSPADGTVSASIQASAVASAEAGPAVNSIVLEVDGKAFASTQGASIVRSLASAGIGGHRVRAVALNQAGVAGASGTVGIFILPGSSQLVVRPSTQIASTANPDGTTSFSGTLRVDNTFAGTRGPFQVVITETPGPALWEFFGIEDLVPERTESLLQVIDLPTVQGNGNASIEVDGTVSPTELVGDGLQGVGWTVTARLRELVSGVWIDRDSVTLLETRPRLREETPGPNGGVPLVGFDGGEGFDPALLQDLVIQGPSKVVEGASALLRAVAVFNTGNKACTPQWTITKGAGFASISAEGRLKAGDVTVQQSVTVRATFGGISETHTIRVNPLIPKISVRAAKTNPAENGGIGRFRVTRTGAVNKPLTVAYQVAGTAVPGDDYVALAGTVEIPAGAAAVSLDVTPLDDAIFEGNRTVRVTLDDSPDYRVQGRNAIVTIVDDEEVPEGQPDATIEVKGKKAVGAFQVAFNSVEQHASTRRAKGEKAVFFYTVVNRTAADGIYTISGSGDFLGFSVRYFSGPTDVTASVVDGTYTTGTVPGGGSIRLKVVITPGASTPIGSAMRCVLVSQSQNGLTDRLEAVVQRSR